MVKSRTVRMLDHYKDFGTGMKKIYFTADFAKQDQFLTELLDEVYKVFPTWGYFSQPLTELLVKYGLLTKRSKTVKYDIRQGQTEGKYIERVQMNAVENEDGTFQYVSKGIEVRQTTEIIVIRSNGRTLFRILIDFTEREE